MTYFLLKWIFNAIKQESSKEDYKLKGQEFVTKNDLVKQMTKNPELLHTLGFESAKNFKEHVKYAPSINKEGCFVWDEFCDFFFLKDEPLEKRDLFSNIFYKKISAKEDEEADRKARLFETEEKENKNHENDIEVPKYTGVYIADEDRRDVEMTDQMHVLKTLR